MKKTKWKWMLSSRRIALYTASLLLLQASVIAPQAQACVGIACLMGGGPVMPSPYGMPQGYGPQAMDPQALGQWQAHVMEQQQNAAIMGFANFVNYNGAQKFGVNTSPHMDGRPIMPPMGGSAIVNRLLWENALPACMEDGSC